MYVCMCVCMYVCMYVCKYVSMYDTSVASISGKSYKHKYSLLKILVDHYLTNNSKSLIPYNTQVVTHSIFQHCFDINHYHKYPSNVILSK